MELPGGCLSSAFAARYAGYVNDPVALCSQLLQHSAKDLIFAQLPEVIRLVAQRCSCSDQLRNLLLAVAVLADQSPSLELPLVQAVLSEVDETNSERGGTTSYRDRNNAIVAALLQLAEPEAFAVCRPRNGAGCEPWQHHDEERKQQQEQQQLIRTAQERWIAQHQLPWSEAFSILAVGIIRLAAEIPETERGSGGQQRPQSDWGLGLGLDPAQGAAAAVTSAFGAQRGAFGHDCGAGSEEEGAAAAAAAAAAVLRRLDAVARRRCPLALGALGQAVATLLLPLDPAAAYSWAERLLRECFSAVEAPEPDVVQGQDEIGPTAWPHGPLGGGPAGAADGDGVQQQHVWVSLREAARCCAAPLVAIMGLPGLLHLCEEVLAAWAAGRSGGPRGANTHPPQPGVGGSRKQQYHLQRPDRVGLDRSIGAGGPSWGAARAGVGACGAEEEDVPPVALLLQAVVREGGKEYSTAVWGCLTRVLLRALGARGQELPAPGVVVGQEGGVSDGAAEVAAAAAAEAVFGGRGADKGMGTGRADVELAAAVLAAAEVLIGEGQEEAESAAARVVAAGVQGAAGGEGGGSGGSATGAAVWERLLQRAVGMVVVHGASVGGQQGVGRTCMAALRALQQRITSTTSAAALGVYERVLAEALRAERSAGGSGVAGGGMAGGGVAGGGRGDAGGEAASRDEWRDQMQLLQSAVHSRVQHLRERAEAEGLGWGGAELGAGAGAGGPGAGAGRGAAAALKTGDPQFALQCLEEYARLGADHLKRVSGVLRSRWLCDAKPVLLRLTLSEQEARTRHGYLQAACEGFRGLVSTADLDRFERLHEALLGVDLGSVAGRGSTAGGGSGSGAGAVACRPLETTLRRLAAVAPALPDPHQLAQVMAVVEAEVAEELAEAGGSCTEAAGVRGEGGGGGAAGAAQPVVQASSSGGGGGCPLGAAGVVELVLQAFVAAEQLAVDAEARAEAKAAPASRRPGPPPREAALRWQLPLVGVLCRRPELQRQLVRRVTELCCRGPRCAAEQLSPVQVGGLAALLAVMGCFGALRRPTGQPTGHQAAAGQDRDGGAREEGPPLHQLSHGHARHLWQCELGSGAVAAQGRGTEKGMAATGNGVHVRSVWGPALAAEVLGALPLGPGPQQLRFTAAFLVSYLRHCALFPGRWAVAEVPHAAAHDGDAAGGHGVGQEQQHQQHQQHPGRNLFTAVAVEDAPTSVAGGGGSSGGAGHPEVACVPALALQTLAWVARMGDLHSGAGNGGNAHGRGREEGEEEGASAAAWVDVRGLCGAFAASRLGRVMLGQAAALNQLRPVTGSEVHGGKGGGSDGEELGGGGRRLGEVGGLTDVWELAWDPQVALEVQVRALGEGLPWPRGLLRQQAVALLQHMG